MEATITSAAARNEFMQLLVAQLQNQDPLQPVPQHEFLAQLAQFSTLEGIENLNSNFEQVFKAQLANQEQQSNGLEELNTSMASLVQLQQVNQGANLIGKHVIYTESETDASQSGGSNQPQRYTSEDAVTGVEFRDGTLQLRVGGGTYIPMSHVYGIVAAS